MKDCIVVICSDYAHPGIPGYWDICEECIVNIYVSNSTLSSITDQGHADKRIRLLCFECAYPLLDASQMMPLSKQQLKEIKDSMGKS